MTRNLQAVLALAIGMSLVSDLVAVGRLEDEGRMGPVNISFGEARLAALENEIANLKSSLAHYEQHVGDSWRPKPAGWVLTLAIASSISNLATHGTSEIH